MPNTERKIEIPIIYVLGGILISVGSFFLPPPLERRFKQDVNYGQPNALLSPEQLSVLRRRNLVNLRKYLEQLQYQGFDADNAGKIYDLTRELLTLADLAQLKIRGEIDFGQYVEKTGEAGFDVKDAEYAIKLTEQRLPPQAVITALWRKLRFNGGKEKIKDELRQQGWTDDRIDLMIKTALYYPSAQDWVYFARRDIFNPDAVKKFGYDEDYPAAQEKDVAKIGMSPDHWKYYWRAHWRDLGTGEVFTMLHRGIIDDDEALLLLRTSNFAPRLAEKLMKAAYSPYSRVDVRRMFKLGVLDKDDVKKNYQSLGYDEAHAQKLADFTEKWAKDTPTNEQTDEDKRREELKGLTKTAIIKEYKDAYLTKDETKKYLTDLGFSDEVANLYINMTDYENAADKTDAYVKILHRMYLNGVIGYNSLSDALDKLNIPARQKDYYTDLWDLERENKPNQPSKTELIKFYKKGIINRATFIDEMGNLGYSKKYINWYLQDLGIKS